jgi:Tfp pilus assembly protein PilP
MMTLRTRIPVVLAALAVAWAYVAMPPVAAAGQAQESINAARRARGQSEAASAGRGQTPPAPARGAAAPQTPAPAPAPARGGAPAPAPAAQAPAAQAPAPGGAAAPAAQGQPAAPAQPPLETQGFTYNPEGRRDPFVSLLRGGGAMASGGGSQGARPAGLAGLGVNEVTLRGTVQSRDGFVAILQGSDQKTYIVRPGDKLFDGSVRTITQNDMVFLQEVNDPLSLEKQREVRKVLRQTEGQN